VIIRWTHLDKMMPTNSPNIGLDREIVISDLLLCMLCILHILISIISNWKITLQNRRSDCPILDWHHSDRSFYRNRADCENGNWPNATGQTRWIYTIGIVLTAAEKCHAVLRLLALTSRVCVGRVKSRTSKSGKRQFTRFVGPATGNPWFGRISWIPPALITSVFEKSSASF